MSTNRTRMVQTICRVGTAVRIKSLPKNKLERVRKLQGHLAELNSYGNCGEVTRGIRKEHQDSIMRLVYPHVLHEHREHSKPVDPYEETEF